MKKILLEYANIIGMTVTGLIFGLSFFLLFINFYHMQELGTTYDVTTFNETNKAEINEKINTIKNNLSVYSQSTYTGDLNIFALNNIQNNLNSCLVTIESEEFMSYLDKDVITIKDSYDFVTDFNNLFLNDCLVMSVNSLFNSNALVTLPNYSTIRPFVSLNVTSLINGSSDYQNMLENAGHYYFSTNTNKTNFFDLVRNSYNSTMSRYQTSLDLLVEISNWYRTLVIGG